MPCRSGLDLALTLFGTIDRWWTEITAFIDTGYSNAKSEGINA
ncbi:transposase [Streptomyces siamensis]